MNLSTSSSLSNNKDKNLYKFIFCISLFRLLLEFSYVNVMSVSFAYDGYTLDFNIINYIFSWILYFIALSFVKDRMTKVSDFFFITALLSVVLPITVVYAYDSSRNSAAVLTLIFSLFFVKFITTFKFISFKKLVIVKNGLSLVVIISLFFVFFLVIWYFFSGVNLNFNFNKVYDFRADNYELAGIGILRYTNNWTYLIFNIALFAIALLHKKYFFAFVIVVIQTYFFAASAHKIVFFLPFLVLSVWYYFRQTNSLVALPLSFSLILILALIYFYYSENLFIPSLIIRRLFFVPANLAFSYFEFFSFNPKVFWSNGILSSFLSYPYDLSLTHMIGRFIGREGMGANNGYVSHGFAHAGYFGVIIYSIILGLLLKLIDDMTYNKLPLWFSISLSIAPLRTVLINSDLFTTMLTHGLFISLIIIFLSRSNYDYS
jgi:hypothetical protein